MTQQPNPAPRPSDDKAPVSDPLHSVRQAVIDHPAYPYTPSKARHKLDQNESPYDFPPQLKAEALRRIADTPFQLYAQVGDADLRSRLGAFENWDAGGIVFAAGSNVLIKVLTEVVGLGQTVLATDPTFAVYPMEGKMLETNYISVPIQDDLSLPAEKLKQHLRKDGPGLFVLIEPQVPTGYVDDAAVVEELVDLAAQYGWVTVIDEAYFQFAGTDYKELVRRYPNAASMRTFSKAWGLAGLRLGYLLTSPELAAQLQKMVPAFSVNVLTRAVIEVALENPGYVQERIAKNNAERDRVVGELQRLGGWKVWPSHTNFFLIQAPDNAAARALLERHDIAVRGQSTVPVIGECLRVTVGSPEQNDTLLAAARVAAEEASTEEAAAEEAGAQG